MNAIITYLKGIIEDYLQDLTIPDVVLLELCMLAVGMLFGLALPEKYKPKGMVALFAIFVGTYVPLLMKVIPYMKEESYTLLCDET